MNEKEETEIILSQWKTCVEMADSVSKRRDSMNNIFITLNLAILATVSIKLDLKSVFILVAGILICSLWILFIRNYKLLNEAKFEVIHNLESKLTMNPLQDEWAILESNKKQNKNDNNKISHKYKDTTTLEEFLPITFIILYSVMIITIVVIMVLHTGGN